MKLTFFCFSMVMFTSNLALAQLDWGSDCSDGSGNADQRIEETSVVGIGHIPAGKRNVHIDLESPVDADIQLIDAATGKVIIGWPSGLLDGSETGEVQWHGVTYRYSGYQGLGGNPGREFIEIVGTSQRELIVQVFGFRGGQAEVSYRWQAVPTCREKGQGRFDRRVDRRKTVTIGEIPAGKVNVHIELEARQGEDLDLVLVDDESQVDLVGWPDGLLQGFGPETVTYEDMVIEYSGYGGVDGRFGRETIDIRGAVTRGLAVKAFGFTAGQAQVSHSWGNGVGQICDALGASSCLQGLVCKEETSGDLSADRGGRCHTASWCLNSQQAARQCAGRTGTSRRTTWHCAEFECLACPSLFQRRPEDCRSGWQIVNDERGCPTFECRVSESETCGGLLDTVCGAGLTCHLAAGEQTGVCVRDILGRGDCWSDSDCEDQQRCSNFNVLSPVVVLPEHYSTHISAGICLPAEMLGRFQATETISIPPNETRDSVIAISGLATVGLNAVANVELNLGGSSIEEADLVFEILPGETGYNTKFTLDSLPPDRLQLEDDHLRIIDLPIAAPSDDSVNLGWTLKVTNQNQDGNSVELLGWSLRVSSRWD